MKVVLVRSYGLCYGIMCLLKIFKFCGLKYWDMGYVILFIWEFWVVFVFRIVLCNSWGVRGIVDLKIYILMLLLLLISLFFFFWNGNVFILCWYSVVVWNVFDVVMYFLLVVECYDCEGLGKRWILLISFNLCNVDYFFKMVVDSVSVVWSVVKLVWSV